MKRFILNIVFILLINMTFFSCRPHVEQNWKGQYAYTNKAGVFFHLNISEDYNYVNYTGNGPDTDFNAHCIGKVEGDEFVIYYREILEDADEGFNKPKNNRVKLIKLYYQKGELYTEGYYSSDKEVDKGPKILFKKIIN